MEKCIGLFQYMLNGKAKVFEIEVRHNKRYSGESKYGISRVPKVILDLIVVKFLKN